LALKIARIISLGSLAARGVRTRPGSQLYNEHINLTNSERIAQAPGMDSRIIEPIEITNAHWPADGLSVTDTRKRVTLADDPAVGRAFEEAAAGPRPAR
jgi:hypothetical protein